MEIKRIEKGKKKRRRTEGNNIRGRAYAELEITKVSDIFQYLLRI